MQRVSLDGVGGGGISDLAAHIVHVGALYAGHYTARVLARGLWWTCDDKLITRCPPGVVESLSGDIYGLVYTRR